MFYIYIYIYALRFDFKMQQKTYSLIDVRETKTQNLGFNNNIYSNCFHINCLQTQTLEPSVFKTTCEVVKIKIHQFFNFLHLKMCF